MRKRSQGPSGRQLLGARPRPSVRQQLRQREGREDRVRSADRGRKTGAKGTQPVPQRMASQGITSPVSRRTRPFLRQSMSLERIRTFFCDEIEEICVFKQTPCAVLPEDPSICLAWTSRLRVCQRKDKGMLSRSMRLQFLQSPLDFLCARNQHLRASPYVLRSRKSPWP